MASTQSTLFLVDAHQIATILGHEQQITRFRPSRGSIVILTSSQPEMKRMLEGARNDDENDSSAKTIDLKPRGDQSVIFA